MRAEFEAWLQPYWSRESYLDPEGDRIYREEWVQGAWIGWQASRKQALEECKVALIACDLGGLSLGDGIEAIRAMQRD